MEDPKAGWVRAGGAAAWASQDVCAWSFGPHPQAGAIATRLHPGFSLAALPRQRRRAPPGAAEQMRSLLARTVTSKVVPRLQHSLADDQPEVEPGPEDVAALVALAMTSDLPTTMTFIQAIRARGVALEDLYLQLLAPAARRIGELWEEDLCTFVDVTEALGRLQRLLQELSPAYIPPAGQYDPRRRAALVAAPGEQHSFGLALVTEFFLQAGWEVWAQPVADEAELLAQLQGHWFAVLGLSVARNEAVTALPGLIAAARRASRNPAMAVMVGGRVFLDNPALAQEIGADATASDGRQAALQAETLLALQSRPRPE
ncbi:cobalamin B12-binding domain-containing protein [Belnapia rosea]|uniref:Methanogenic corrinoid protein MtbC1 n=1 Tax=Belnapia rosea TaxID=938405 RepID=A0A1G6QSH4_9PROT|nr:cobalamin-dependent protein [Belnapia rosea]SDB63507.1 Methanogenic corrinoid protein MtbC1 [Belnapia rosea]SDC95312.1 Methanogenic corrinoid protein MtbC1 [Belnapia rosea]